MSAKAASRAIASVVMMGLVVAGCVATGSKNGFRSYELDYTTPVSLALQGELVQLDAALRTKYGMTTAETAVGVLDLRERRLAMIHPDRIEYAASVPKIGILLAYFALNPGAATNLDAETRRELGLMIKASSNEMAAKYSEQLGLKRIQEVLNAHGFYDERRGGGLWVGKHYGKGTERYADPVGGHSHGATVRQLLRFYLMMEQGRLVSAEASRAMKEIFKSPDIGHLEDKFVKGLRGRKLEILRKSGWWENWFHDTALVKGEGRNYVVVALTRHAQGAKYLEEFAVKVDDLIAQEP